MELSALRKKPHLSASSINEYAECSLAYKFRRVDKLPIETRSDNFEFGTVIHKVLEVYYSEKMIGNKMPLKDIHANFEDCWREAAEGQDDIQYSKGKDFRSCLSLGKAMLTAWHEKLPSDDFTIVGIEQPFSFALPELPVPIIGAIDLIEQDDTGTLIITDFKTSAKAFSTAAVDRNFQLTIYSMAVKSNGYKNREVILKFDALIKTTKPKFEQYYTTRTEYDHKRAIRKIQSVWDGINKQVFIPNDQSWKCKGCQYQKACNEWFLSKEAA